MAHCSHINNCASIFLDGKKILFQIFNLKFKVKINMDHWCQYGNLSSESRSQRFLAFQHTRRYLHKHMESFGVVSHIKKTKI